MCDATEGRNRQRRVFEKGGHLRCADTARTSGSNEGRGLRRGRSSRNQACPAECTPAIAESEPRVQCIVQRED